MKAPIMPARTAIHSPHSVALKPTNPSSIRRRRGLRAPRESTPNAPACADPSTLARDYRSGGCDPPRGALRSTG